MGSNELYSYPNFTDEHLRGVKGYGLPILEADEPGELEINIGSVYLSGTGNMNTGGKGLYIRLKGLTIQDDNSDPRIIAESLTVNTAYSQKNNISLTRRPNFGVNTSDVLAPIQVKNGLYIKDASYYIGSEQWKLGNSIQPLSVLIHQQILSYYAKPNNVLTGELATDNPSFNALYAWNGKHHLLTSGALNIITGRMENVVLREFARYDHMWQTWCETDDVEVDFAAATIQLRVHSNKTITSADLSGLPLWLIGSVQSAGNGVYVVSLAVEANSSSERTTIINIDTALVRITQLAPGDYGLDYGEDYS
jgi:hypothetical protein